MIYFEKIKRYLIKYKLFIISFLLVLYFLLLLILFLYFNNQINNKNKIEQKTDIVNKAETNKKNNLKEIKVDIKGEVLNPGIYTLDENKRIDDVTKLAVLTENADTSLINLSKKVEDEMVIIIHTKEEVIKFKEQDNLEELEIYTNSTNTHSNISKENKPAQNSLVNLNTSTLEQLKTLSGIGDAKAKLIIEYRNSNSFKKTEDIKNIKGIGDSIFEKIKNNITV